MRYFYKERVEVCEDAIYFVDPIEGVNKLYTQRQRWQRGSLEVAKMFSHRSFHVFNMFKDVNVKTIMYDHTFAFPRMIWYLALICLLCMNYSGSAIVIATMMISVMYIIIGYLYFFSTQVFLRNSPDIRKYYCKQWWVVMVLPIFNFVVFFIRLAGIVNSINTDSAWKTRDLTDERKAFWQVLADDAKKILNKIRKVRDFINSESGNEQQNASAESAAAQEAVAASKAVVGRKSVGWHICISLVYILSVLIIVVCHFVNITYGVGLNELISTFSTKLKGTSSDVVNLALSNCLPPVLIAIAAVAAFIIIDRIKFGAKLISVKKAIQRVMAVGSVIVFFVSIFYVNYCFDVVGYFKTSIAQTRLYDDYYVPPDTVVINDNGDAKNLIYIYIESLETTYASKEAGGAQSDNYIPNLTKLAEENVSFSDSDKLGGFHSTNGTGITIGALFGTTSGAAYSLGTEVNQMLEQGNFLSGIVTLGDVLEQKGYKQEFLCGSDGDFGERKTYFEQHGNYEVFDLYTARERGYIADDYYVWWGFEDAILYEIAKDEVTDLAQSGEPFNFTMLTVDPHHMDGYICDQCGDEYDNVTANVMKCSDRLLGDFIDWCKQQDFYKDTVIVVTGDHPRMDTSLVEGVSYYDRTVYNCFINSSNDGTYNENNRIFTPMDIFPTVLSAMGYSIEGDRLALGTNLFSDKPTLAEEKGFEWLDTELSTSSKYYYKVFAPELSQ